ncbi:SM-20-related protein [Paracandidimonas soli]|uniref:SM-20-related protein n=1 Tax=Paracandidimonas soli TaxID=1917182 RepID=A0A4V2VSK5_9BURK|nr:SM-20-related protein [Paracandidimonas soli]
MPFFPVPPIVHIPDRLLEDLEHDGWTMSDDIIPAGLAHRLLSEGRQRWQQGQFHAATIGRTSTQQHNAAIRGDTICWIDEPSPYPDSAEFLQCAALLRQTLNRHFFLGLRHLECHFARYEPGAGYARHIDQHKNTGFRKISMVLYLNQDWQPGDGGELCIYDPDEPDREVRRIIPKMGRIALFRSDTIPHAVLPSGKTRWSLTGWFRNDTPF